MQAIRDRLAAIAVEYPGWAGRTVTLATVWQAKPSIYAILDPRVQLLNEMGLQNNAEVVTLSTPGTFYLELTEETPAPFDSDLLLWFADEGVAPIEALAFRPILPAVNEGREIFLAAR